MELSWILKPNPGSNEKFWRALFVSMDLNQHTVINCAERMILMKWKIDLSKMKLAEDTTTFRGKYAYFDLPNGDKILYEICPYYPYSCEPYIKGVVADSFQFGYTYFRNTGTTMLAEQKARTNSINFTCQRIPQWKRLSSFQRYANKMHKKSFDELVYMFHSVGYEMHERVWTFKDSHMGISERKVETYFDEFDLIGDIDPDILVEIQENAFERFFSSEIDYSSRNNEIERRDKAWKEQCKIVKELNQKIKTKKNQKGYWYELLCEYLGVKDLESVVFEYNEFLNHDERVFCSKRMGYLQDNPSIENEIEYWKMWPYFPQLERHKCKCRLGSRLRYDSENYISTEVDPKDPYWDRYDIKQVCRVDDWISAIPFDSKYEPEIIGCADIIRLIIHGNLKVVKD